jgi:medium-chain acyl-[acyl-carrier-protein] hydrolase
MDAMTLDKWVPFRNEGSVVRCRLFCFPHAAGNAAFYRPLRRFMPPEVDFCPLELPGRAARLDEPPFTSMSTLMERLDHALQPLMGVPFGFFGHSVGACMAFEAARQLRSVDGQIAVHLFVSGRGGPKFASADPPQARPPSDRDLLAILGRFGGTPAAVMQRPELIAALLPALRADLALVAAYAVDPEDRVTCPSPHLPAPTMPLIPVRFSPGETSPAENFGPAFSLGGIFTSPPRRPLSPRRSSRTCMHPWACTRQMRDRRYDASLRRSSGVIDR